MRPDLRVIADLVRTGSRVLDLGCGDGELLTELIQSRGCSGQGVEITHDGVMACIASGVPVIQGDIDEGVSEIEPDSFDIVILSQVLQTTHRPAKVLADMLRAAPIGIVSFPNFGHWRLRGNLALRGRMPASGALPYSWHDTPNIHLCTLSDFEQLANSSGARIAERVWLNERGEIDTRAHVRTRPNLLAAAGVYRLVRG